jgi:hypothetical protein
MEADGIPVAKRIRVDVDGDEAGPSSSSGSAASAPAGRLGLAIQVQPKPAPRVIVESREVKALRWIVTDLALQLEGRVPMTLVNTPGGLKVPQLWVPLCSALPVSYVPFPWVIYLEHILLAFESMALSYGIDSPYHRRPIGHDCKWNPHSGSPVATAFIHRDTARTRKWYTLEILTIIRRIDRYIVRHPDGTTGMQVPSRRPVVLDHDHHLQTVVARLPEVLELFNFNL